MNNTIVFNGQTISYEIEERKKPGGARATCTFSGQIFTTEWCSNRRSLSRRLLKSLTEWEAKSVQRQAEMAKLAAWNNGEPIRVSTEAPNGQQS